MLPPAVPPGGTRPRICDDDAVGHGPGCDERQRRLRADRRAHQHVDARNGVAGQTAHRRLVRRRQAAVAWIRAVDLHDGRARVIDLAAGVRAELEGQSLAHPRVDREVHPLPVAGASRSEVGLPRDVVLSRDRRRRGRRRIERDGIPPAAREPRVGRRVDRPRVVLRRIASLVVGDGEAVERAARIRDVRRHAREHLLLHADAPLPVIVTHAPSPERVLVHLRDVAGVRRRSSGCCRSAPRTLRWP